MASGLSTRFGTNKLLAEFKGKSLISLIVDKTSDLSGNIKKRIVLTRTPEVYEYCNALGIESYLHSLPNRNEAVHLGMEHMKDLDACIFCTCDQPLLKKESIDKLIAAYLTGGPGIYRLSYGEKVGNPILFSKEYFEELSNLPEKKGGSYIANKYPDDVTLIPADDEWELYDVDTPDDIKMLSEIKR